MLYITTLPWPFARIYRYQWLNGCAGLLFLFSAGTSLAQLQPASSSLPTDEDIYIQAVVDKKAQRTGRYIKTPVTVYRYGRQAAGSATVSSAPRLYSIKEASLLYLEADSAQALPELGDTLSAWARLNTLAVPQHPGEFDYRTHMARKGVFATGFVRAHHYRLSPGKTTGWAYWPERLQARAENIFREMGLQGDELAVLNALTLGDRTAIDQELNRAFTIAGVTHILSVSGLHVGLIFAILSKLLSFLGKRKRGLVIKNTLIIIVLWSYAAISGFSPSVNRATVMFSFVLAGKIMQRDISIYNSLAASAFFLCLINPFNLFDIGFQLSYLALLSLVYFQPYIYRLLYFPNKVVNYIWEVCSVSLAAQLGTLPLSLFIFHQFPNYFILSNLWALPLTGVTTYLSVALLTLNRLPYVSAVIAWLLEKSLWLLNSGVRFTEALPYAVSEHIAVSAPQLWLMSALVLLFALYIEFREKRLLYCSVLLLTAILNLNLQRATGNRQQQLLAVYNVKNSAYIHLIDGNNSLALRDSASLTRDFSFNLQGFFTDRGIRRDRMQCLQTGVPLCNRRHQHLAVYRNFFIFGNNIIKVLSREDPLPFHPMMIDYLIVTAACRQDPASLLDIYHPRQVVVDASVPAYRSRLWKTAAGERQVALHNVKQDGAFIAQLSN